MKGLKNHTTDDSFLGQSRYLYQLQIRNEIRDDRGLSGRLFERATGIRRFPVFVVAFEGVIEIITKILDRYAI